MENTRNAVIALRREFVGGAQRHSCVKMEQRRAQVPASVLAPTGSSASARLVALSRTAEPVTTTVPIASGAPARASAKLSITLAIVSSLTPVRVTCMLTVALVCWILRAAGAKRR